MDGACGTHGEEKSGLQTLLPKRKIHLLPIASVDGELTVKWLSKKWDLRV